MKRFFYIFVFAMLVLCAPLGSIAKATDTNQFATYLFGTRYVPEEVVASPDAQWVAMTVRGNGIPYQDFDTLGVWILRTDGTSLTRVLSINDIVALTGVNYTPDKISWGGTNTLIARVGYWSIWKLKNFLPGPVSVSPSVPPAMSTIRITPTPSNNDVNIEFALASEQQLEVVVYDVSGRKVDTIKERTRFGSGSTYLVWKPKSGTSGIYFIRAQGESFQATSRAVILK